jgi:4-hydroxyacetophenone monooxygenase
LSDLTPHTTADLQAVAMQRPPGAALADGFDPAMLAADPARLRAALEEADAATLMLVLVTLSGDPSWLERARPYITGPTSYHETMPAEMRAEIRTALVDVLLDFAANPRPLPPIPGGQLLVDMLNTAAGTTVGEDYVAMMREDLQPAEIDPRGMVWRHKPDKKVLDAFHVVVIGAGVSGMCAAIRLQQAGIPFTIIEKNETVSGTWYENSYPGCGVDTPNHFYSYSFEPNHDWSHFFAKRDELWQYFEGVADKHDLRRRTHFGVEVTSCTWDEAAQTWTIEARRQDGSLYELKANAVMSAAGILNRPKLPDIPGRDSFAGPTVHTGKWDPAFDWKGKRIAMIGTGASGHQVGPTIAPDVKQLMIFQRSPHWVVPNPNYFAEVADGKKWVLANVPYYLRWYRFQLFWAFADGLHPALKIDPEWHDAERSINEQNNRQRIFMERHMKRELGEDSPLLAKVVPDYPPYGKRILIDNHWFKMLQQPNVDLVTDQIERIVPEGIVTRDGQMWPADAIIYATGFQASKMLAPMRITGVGGVEIHDVWKPDDATAYLGTTIPGFPNFFTLLGPNTGLAHGGNVIFMSECQVRYVMMALREVIEGGHHSLDVKPAVHDAYVEEVDTLHNGMVWSHKGLTNWYRNPAGRVFAVLPYRLVDYWQMTSKFTPEEYRFG